MNEVSRVYLEPEHKKGGGTLMPHPINHKIFNIKTPSIKALYGQLGNYDSITYTRHIKKNTITTNFKAINNGGKVLWYFQDDHYRDDKDILEVGIDEENILVARYIPSRKDIIDNGAKPLDDMERLVFRKDNHIKLQAEHSHGILYYKISDSKGYPCIDLDLQSRSNLHKDSREHILSELIRIRNYDNYRWSYKLEKGEDNYIVTRQNLDNPLIGPEKVEWCNIDGLVYENNKPMWEYSQVRAKLEGFTKEEVMRRYKNNG